MYLAVKVIHILAVISWMAGVLYLFRLFINHVENAHKGADINALLEGMEQRLYRFITVNSMIVAWLAGIVMVALNPVFLTSGWLMVKLTTVLALTAFTLYGGHLIKVLARDPTSAPSARNLRILNEVPAVFMAIIVIMVVVKPF